MGAEFLYIDDEKTHTSEGIIKNLRDSSLDFTIEKPVSWNDQKANLIENCRINEFDGLLLDLKLEFSDGKNNDVKFSGADLAQTIRSEVKAGKIKDLPIFLCSTDNFFMKFFDRTSVDLFDKKYEKNKDLVEEKTKFEFISFANAYQRINDDFSIANLMQRNIDDNEELISLQAEMKEFKTPHEFVYLINRFVIQSSGILIDEELLAIRLGVDIQTSSDWKILKDKLLKDFEYIGILGDFYKRWWQSEILKWWKTIGGKSLKVMSAQEKVDFLKKISGLSNIVPLPLPEQHRFDTFWYKCRLSKNPLDPSDALRTIEMPRYSWQEPNYISLAYIKSDDRDLESITSLLGSNETKIFRDL